MKDLEKYCKIHFKDMDISKLSKKEIKEIKKSVSYGVWLADEKYTRYLESIAEAMQNTIDELEKKIRG